MFSYTWLIIGAVLLATELATGTFYLLMLAVAALAAWLAEGLGADFLAQSLVFLVSSGLLVSLVHRYRKQKALSATKNIADQLDAGEIVHVSAWHNGVGQTHYRGAAWQTILAEPIDHPNVGEYRIIRFEGTRLLVQPIKQ